MFDIPADQGTNPLAQSQTLNRPFDWIRDHQRGVLLVGVGVQLVVLLGLIVYHAVPLWFGDTVLLRVVPVDPRDLMRGDYVILGYDVSRAPAQGIQGIPTGEMRKWRGRTVYVTLVPEADGRHYKGDKFTIVRPQGGKYLQGELVGWNRIEYGIESFYVQEGTGREYERAVRRKKLSAEVGLSSSGQATLKGLRIQ